MAGKETTTTRVSKVRRVNCTKAGVCKVGKDKTFTGFDEGRVTLKFDGNVIDSDDFSIEFKKEKRCVVNKVASFYRTDLGDDYDVWLEIECGD